MGFYPYSAIVIKILNYQYFPEDNNCFFFVLFFSNCVLCLFRIAVNELQKLQYLPRVSGPREMLAEDRTKCHADHVGHGLDRYTTAAVGVLKAIHVNERLVSFQCFYILHFDVVVQRLLLKFCQLLILSHEVANKCK